MKSDFAPFNFAPFTMPNGDLRQYSEHGSYVVFYYREDMAVLCAKCATVQLKRDLTCEECNSVMRNLKCAEIQEGDTEEYCDNCDKELTNRGAMKIRISCNDSDNSILCIAASAKEAKLDQSIDGSRWEFDGNFAYASIENRPNLVEYLESLGYEVDSSEYLGFEE